LISQEHGLSRGVYDAAAVSSAVAALATRLVALEDPTDIAQHVAEITSTTLGLDAAVFLADGGLPGMSLAGCHPTEVPAADLVDREKLLDAIGTDEPAALEASDRSRELACFPMSQDGKIEGALVLFQGREDTRPLVELNVAEAFARVGGVGLARARASQVARATEQLLGITVDNVPIGMAMYGADRVLRRSSMALERILGARMEPGSCAEHAFDQFEPVTEADAERVAAVTTALNGGDAVQHEVELRDRRSGRALRLECGVVPLPDGGVGLVLQDVTRRWQAELDRDNLLRHLVSAQEEERRRLAADLHDDLIQALVAGLMDLDLLETRLGGDGDIGTRIRRTRASFEHALKAARSLLFDLRPPVLETYGLAAAVRQQLDKVAEQTGCDTTLDWEPEGRLDRVIEAIVFRTVQEAVSNAARHGKPKRMSVRGTCEGNVLTVEVCDDGAGFDAADQGTAPPRPGHLGLRSMAERIELAGGIFQLDSTPGEGTRVTFWVPLRGDGAA
jgi:signal transduction histidine kinase